MSSTTFDNPWSVQSIYELQYFNCPSCVFKNHSKQDFINHGFKFHPEAIEHLINIQKDGSSLSDIDCPWDIKEILIKEDTICLLYTSPSPRDQRG